MRVRICLNCVLMVFTGFLLVFLLVLDYKGRGVMLRGHVWIVVEAFQEEHLTNYVWKFFKWEL